MFEISTYCWYLKHHISMVVSTCWQSFNLCVVSEPISDLFFKVQLQFCSYQEFMFISTGKIFTNGAVINNYLNYETKYTSNTVVTFDYFIFRPIMIQSLRRLTIWTSKKNRLEVHTPTLSKNHVPASKKLLCLASKVKLLVISTSGFLSIFER